MTGSGEHQVEIEVAESPDEKALGLMYRSGLPSGRGMLFPYAAPQVVNMWMKNTYIPLDMLFIREDGVVHRIEKYAEPQSEAVISSGAAVKAVLEIAGGEADRLGLKPGDAVRYSIFKRAE